MLITLELDYETMRKYAEFLGLDEVDEESLINSDYFKYRLKEDIEFVVDTALYPYEILC